MLNLLLLPVIDPVRVTDYLIKLQGTSHEWTNEELHNLSRLLEQYVRMSEGLWWNTQSQSRRGPRV